MNEYFTKIHQKFLIISPDCETEMKLYGKQSSMKNYIYNMRKNHLNVFKYCTSTRHLRHNITIIKTLSLIIKEIQDSKSISISCLSIISSQISLESKRPGIK